MFAFIRAKRTRLTEEVDGSGAGLCREGKRAERIVQIQPGEMHSRSFGIAPTLRNTALRLSRSREVRRVGIRSQGEGKFVGRKVVPVVAFCRKRVGRGEFDFFQDGVFESQFLKLPPCEAFRERLFRTKFIKEVGEVTMGVHMFSGRGEFLGEPSQGVGFCGNLYVLRRTGLGIHT